MKKKKKITKKILEKREKKRLKRELHKKLELWKERVIQRDNVSCQKCGKLLVGQLKHVHHIISFQNVMRKYPEILEDDNNGILLCSYCHRLAPDSFHQGGFEACVWLRENKLEQFEYLLNIIILKRKPITSFF
jgi:5-methylcytosine-specific restriction endonuclease McrA